MAHIVPALIHQVSREVYDQIGVVAGVVTGGAMIVREVVQFIQSERQMTLEPPSCLVLRHTHDDGEEIYGVTNDDEQWLGQWRKEHQGRSPQVLLVDDVIYSSKTAVACVEVLRRLGMPVKAMLHIAGTREARPKLLKDIAQGCLFEFDAGPIYRPRSCPMCLAGQEKTIL
ncbi:MAG: phosphoribosyltransferase [Candidatus Doudnabacteria bacterium]|nr:phosphoribosyltransferase [Candidatus Doudnabacteria bacterium]